MSTRATWLTWMWLARTMMIWCVALFAWGLAAGRTFSIISGIVCLFVNAGTAEFSRRRLEK